MDITIFRNMIFAIISYGFIFLDVVLFCLYKLEIMEIIEDFMNNKIKCTIILLLLFIELFIQKKYFFNIVLKLIKSNSKDNLIGGKIKDITLQYIVKGIYPIISLLIGLVSIQFMLILFLVLLFMGAIYPNPLIFSLFCFNNYHVYETDKPNIWIFSKQKLVAEHSFTDLIKLNRYCFLDYSRS